MAIRLRRAGVMPTQLGRIGGTLLIVALLVAAWSLYFAGDWRNLDVDFYHVYALGFWGNASHRLLPTEYPPLSVLPFSVTLLGPVTWFPVTFALAMAVIAAAGYVAFLRLTSLRQAAAYAIYVLAAGIGTVFYRYDVVPTLLTAAAVWFMYRKRFDAVYPLLAVGTLLKLFPIVLLPVAAVAQWNAGRSDNGRQWRRVLLAAGSCLALVALGFGLAFSIDRLHALTPLTYNFQRPAEVESIPATLLWLTSPLGAYARPNASYGSLNLIGPYSSIIDGLAAAALIGGLIFVYSRQARGRMSVGQAAVCSILVVLATSKVLSPQYLIWVAPLLALTVGFQLRWLFLFLLTALVFPTMWEVGITHTAVPSYSVMFLTTIAIRNGLLVVLTILTLRAPDDDVELHRVSSVAPVQRILSNLKSTPS